MGGTLHNELTTIEPPTKNGMQHTSLGVGRRGRLDAFCWRLIFAIDTVNVDKNCLARTEAS